MPDLTIERCYCCAQVDRAIAARRELDAGECDWIEEFSDEPLDEEKPDRCPKCGGELAVYSWGA